MSIELLAPAGEKEAFLAAVKAGANAVYLGATALNALAYDRTHGLLSAVRPE